WRVTDSHNVTQVFGRAAEARISDPERPERIFGWLLQEICDDRGNVVQFSYKQEDASGLSYGMIAEAHRLRFEDGKLGLRASAQRYIKRIQFGNATPFQPKDFR